MNKTVFAKTLSILIAAAMLLALLPAGFIVAHAESGWCGDNLTWNLDSAGRLTISGTGDMWDYDYNYGTPAPWGTEIISVTIGNGVTRIGEDAFRYCNSLASVTIGNGVTSIYRSAFAGCTSLTSLTIPASVTYVDSWAFDVCSGLTSITVASGNPVYHSAGNCLIETDSNTLIKGCKNSVIPTNGSVTGIGDSAFYGCDSLTSITIPNSVTYIDKYAFSGTGLTSLTIPESVGYIGSAAFSDCPVVLNVKRGSYAHRYAVNNDIPYVTYGQVATSGECGDDLTWRVEGGTLTISGSGDMYDYDSSDYSPWWANDISRVVIGPGVTSIGWYAFAGCTGLTSVTIPDGVTSIGGSAFYGCSGLTSVTIPDSVKYIGWDAFCGCTDLTSVTIPDGVTIIEAGAFEGCTALTSIVMPDGVTSIECYAFSGCTGLTSITIPNSVTYIGDSAFYGCTGLTSLTIPNSVTSIDYSAFSGCDSLRNLTIGNGVTRIGEGAFVGCSGLVSIAVISGNPVYYGAGNCLIERESETLILGCENSVIPTDGSVTSINPYAFYGCTGLTSITIPDGVTSISPYAFGSCTGLTSITIPDSVTTIDEDAFCDTGYYNTESNWQNDVLYIGNWLIKARDQITGHCSIKSGTVGIAGSAFWLGGYYDENDDEYYYYPGPSSVTIPDSVKYICWGAFCGCTELTSITIPDGVTIIDGSVFSDCTGLTSIMMPDGVTSIEDYAFSGCIGLTSITIPDSVTSIGEDAFWYCTGLTSVTIPNSVTYIGEDAFYYYDGDTEENEPLDVTLRVYNNSCAHWYAIDNGLNYELIDPPAVKGDMDGDGEITVADALKALRIAAKLVQPTEEDFAIGDVDGDGEITVADALKILRVAAKLATSLGGDEAKYKVALITDYGDVIDESFNQAAYEGCKEFCKENKIDFNYFKPTGDATESRVNAIKRAIGAGYNVIVMPGFAFGEAIPAVSGKYPDVKFIALDVTKSDLLEAGVAAAGEEYDYNPDNWDLDKYVYMDNVYCTTYREELSGYMAGYAAIKLGYTRLGFLGGMAVPSVVRYGYGFVQGADAAAAELGIYPEINYAYGGQFYGDMDITAVMDTWYQTGTEVVFACGGSIYSSAAEAAAKVWGKVIGVDVDQAAIIDGEYGDGITVTSAMKGIKPSVTDALKAIINDKWDNYKGKVELLGLVSGTDVEANYCQIPYESTQWEDGRFTKEDYVTLVGRMFSGELRVSDDTTAMPAVTNVRVDDQGWIK